MTDKHRGAVVAEPLITPKAASGILGIPNAKYASRAH